MWRRSTRPLLFRVSHAGESFTLSVAPEVVGVEGFILVNAVVGSRSDFSELVGHSGYDAVSLAQRLHADCSRRERVSVFAERKSAELLQIIVWVRRPGCITGRTVRYGLDFARVGTAVVYGPRSA